MKPPLATDAELAIDTPADVVALVRVLATDAERHPEQWENGRLDRYLDALAAWIEDAHGQHGAGMDERSWRFLGQALLAARVYE